MVYRVCLAESPLGRYLLWTGPPFSTLEQAGQPSAVSVRLSSFVGVACGRREV